MDLFGIPCPNIMIGHSMLPLLPRKHSKNR
jgi:hypothetical protein